MKWIMFYSDMKYSLADNDLGVFIYKEPQADGTFKWRLLCEKLGIRYDVLSATTFEDAVAEAQKAIAKKADDLCKKVSEFVAMPYWKNEVEVIDNVAEVADCSKDFFHRMMENDGVHNATFVKECSIDELPRKFKKKHFSWLKDANELDGVSLALFNLSFDGEKYFLLDSPENLGSLKEGGSYTLKYSRTLLCKDADGRDIKAMVFKVIEEQ